MLRGRRLMRPYGIQDANNRPYGTRSTLVTVLRYGRAYIKYAREW